eukprot:3226904-Rhodomonas_salina.1
MFGLSRGRRQRGVAWSKGVRNPESFSTSPPWKSPLFTARKFGGHVTMNARLCFRSRSSTSTTTSSSTTRRNS